VPFPSNYDQAIRQAQESVKAALADGNKLLEVEFPSTSLASVQGDGEGMNEMNASMGFLRQLLSAFRDQAPGIRIFWPDQTELAVARSGQTMDPAAGRAKLDPKFADTSFKMGYLTKTNAVWSTIGVNVGFGQKFSPVQQVKESDELFFVAYPHFNPREELSAVYDIYKGVAAERGIPMVIFNGELDRIRGGYYPSLFFSELAKITNEFLPKFTQAYYIHNFKGTRPGVLFRAYPGPWCVYRRNPADSGDLRLIWTGDNMPSLKEVALDILGSNRMAPDA